MPLTRRQRRTGDALRRKPHPPSDMQGPLVAFPQERGVKRFDEEYLIRNFVRCARLGSSAKILDVGCGFGEKMEWLIKDGYSPHGVDVNAETVRAAQEKGFHCVTPDALALTHDVYDLVLMVHIVEHFHPSDLLAFLDGYLDRLRVGGYLLVATPLEWNNFYADFDHIKVYHPNAFISVMSQADSQVQFHSRHRLRLAGLGLRRRPWEVPAYEDLYREFNDAGFPWRLSRCIKHRLSRWVFRCTDGAMGGVTTGWVGLFVKVA